MAWFEFHQSLVTHRKLYTLAGKLGISRPSAAGHLAFLWAWALDNAPSGDLTNIEPHVLKLAADWPKKADAFLNACVESGFIDRDDVSTTLHDWDDYAGKLRDRRERNKAAMRATRAQHVPTRVKQQNSTTTEPSQNSTTTTTEPPQPVVVNGVDPEHLRRAVAAFDRQSPMGALPDVYQQFEDWLEDGVPVEWIELACSNAAEQGGRKPIAYIRPIIARYKTQGNTEDRRSKPAQNTTDPERAEYLAAKGRGTNSGAGLVVFTSSDEAIIRRYEAKERANATP